MPARLDLQDKILSAHFDALKGLRAALDPLYASFTDKQKKLADQLMMRAMGTV